MKKLISVIICFVFLTGCASFGSNQSYLRYLDAKRAQAQAERQPILDLQLDENGRIKGIKMYPQPVPIRIEQENPHPIYAVVGGALKVIGLVGAIWQTGEAIEGIVEASSGNSTYMNSYNNNSENSGSIDTVTDYSDAKTDTLTTTVETEQ